MKEFLRISLESIDYHKLTQRRIRRIMLICSFYDAYVLEEDGRLEATINQEYHDLNLTHTPTFVRVSTTSEALEVLAKQKDIDLGHVASTWDMANEMISDSCFTEGHSVITFARVLKYDSFPLAAILTDLLEMGRREMRSHVEIEFAVNLDVPHGARQVFNFLQIRPIVDSENRTSLDWSNVDVSNVLLWSKSTVGMGFIEGICDIIYVKQDSFDNTKTEQIAEEIDVVNQLMKTQKRSYVLIGPGRWGSSDKFLGVPVKWGQISEASVIVECGLENFHVDPSQGTHFFQNLISFEVGYITINPFMGDGGFNTDILAIGETISETHFVRHVRFPKPLYIFVDGRNNNAVIKIYEE